MNLIRNSFALALTSVLPDVSKLLPFGTKVRLYRYRLTNVWDNAVSEPSENTFGRCSLCWRSSARLTATVTATRTEIRVQFSTRWTSLFL
jgi:hypothetical protein